MCTCICICVVHHSTHLSSNKFLSSILLYNIIFVHHNFTLTWTPTLHTQYRIISKHNNIKLSKALLLYCILFSKFICVLIGHYACICISLCIYISVQNVGSIEKKFDFKTFNKFRIDFYLFIGTLFSSLLLVLLLLLLWCVIHIFSLSLSSKCISLQYKELFLKHQESVIKSLLFAKNVHWTFRWYGIEVRWNWKCTFYGSHYIE